MPKKTTKKKGQWKTAEKENPENRILLTYMLATKLRLVCWINDKANKNKHITNIVAHRLMVDLDHLDRLLSDQERPTSLSYEVTPVRKKKK